MLNCYLDRLRKIGVAVGASKGGVKGGVVGGGGGSKCKSYY